MHTNLAPKSLSHYQTPKHSNTHSGVCATIITSDVYEAMGLGGFSDRDVVHLAPTAFEYYKVWKHPAEGENNE